jgi:Uma2 family endonuclease
MTVATTRRAAVTIGPNDHGRRMSLYRFDDAIGAEGYTYELNKGVIEVSQVPGRVHSLAGHEVRRQCLAYELGRAGVIFYQGGGSDSKCLIDAFESERHPDWAIYLSPMPELDQPWSIWTPDIVIEIISETSIKRDYEDKPPEYLAIGVSENWILDPIKSRLLVKNNKGGLWQDRSYKPGQKVTSPRLPGFVFDLRRALDAGR